MEDIIVVCATHSAQIQSYLASSRWGEARYPVKVRVVTVASAGSVGDALREIDRLGLVKADFVLIRGGVLSNLPLPSIVEEHRKRKESDKDVMLMTMVLMQTDNGSAFNHRRFGSIYSYANVGIYEMLVFIFLMRMTLLYQRTMTFIDVFFQSISKYILSESAFCIFRKTSHHGMPIFCSGMTYMIAILKFALRRYIIVSSGSLV